MKKQIILHIGPPKTGTTSLQYAFENLKIDRIYYGGAFQPRERNGNSLSKILYDAAKSRGKPDELSAELFNEQVRRLNSGAIILSEEMLSLSTLHEEVECKIKNLSKILSGYSVRILVGARDPSEGLPSLYQELYRSMPINMQLSFDAFCRSNFAKCYDYVYLINQLERYGFCDIVAIPFYDIQAGFVPFSIFPPPLQHGNENILVSRHNAGIVGQEVGQRQLQRVSLKSFGRLNAVKSLLRTTGLRGLPGYRAFVGALDRVTLAPDRMATLALPEDIQAQYESGYRALLVKHAPQLDMTGPHL